MHHVRVVPGHHTLPDPRQQRTPGHDGEDPWAYPLQVSHMPCKLSGKEENVEESVVLIRKWNLMT